MVVVVVADGEQVGGERGAVVAHGRVEGIGRDHCALVRRELEAAYAKGYEEAQRVVMDELKALEYERGRKVAQRQ